MRDRPFVVTLLKHVVPVAAALALLAAAIVAAAAAPAAAAAGLTLPVQIDTRVSLQQQFGYAPAYPRNVPGFDSAGNGFIRSRSAAEDDTSYVGTQEGGVWERRDLLEALQHAYPDFAGTVGAGGYFSAHIVFDTHDYAYTALTIRTEEGDTHNVLLYSVDECETWKTVELPFGDAPACFDDKNLGNVVYEHYAGHNRLEGPPFIGVWTTVAEWPGSWADRNALYVLQPYFQGERLVVPPPVLATDRFLGMLQCAGDSSFAATLGDKTYFTYAQVVAKNRGGTPTYVAVYDHTTGTILMRRRVARTEPINDTHTTPGICLDSQGYLHVVAGSHGRQFMYARSLLPNDAILWTVAQPVLTSGWIAKGTDADGRGRQTYASLVCDQNDVLRLVYRQSRKGIDAWLGRDTCLALCIQSLAPGGTWSPPTMLAVGMDEKDYVNYYQHLAISPTGRLFLSFNYYTHVKPVPLRTYQRFPRRMVWASDDGLTWRWATDADLRASGT